MGISTSKDKAEALLFLAANVYGLIFFLSLMADIAQSRIYEGRDDADFGYLQRFGTTCIPILLFFLVANSTLGVRALWAILKRSGYLKAATFVIILGLWFAAIEYDRCVK